jgi:hypothetical protein
MQENAYKPITRTTLPGRYLFMSDRHIPLSHLLEQQRGTHTVDTELCKRSVKYTSASTLMYRIYPCVTDSTRPLPTLLGESYLEFLVSSPAPLYYQQLWQSLFQYPVQHLSPFPLAGPLSQALPDPRQN